MPMQVLAAKIGAGDDSGLEILCPTLSQEKGKDGAPTSSLDETKNPTEAKSASVGHPEKQNRPLRDRFSLSTNH